MPAFYSVYKRRGTELTSSRISLSTQSNIVTTNPKKGRNTISGGTTTGTHGSRLSAVEDDSPNDLKEIMASAKEEMRTAKRMYDLQVKTANDMRQKFRKLEAEYIELQFEREYLENHVTHSNVLTVSEVEGADTKRKVSASSTVDPAKPLKSSAM